MLSKKIRSFRYALAGVRLAWREEFNFRAEVVLGAGAVVAGFFFGITAIEWIALLSWCAIVLMAEAFNTALEELCDMLRPTHDPHVGKIKDLAAAAVLLSSLGALATGIAIFAPRLIALIS